MLFVLPVTPATLPRVNELRAAARPARGAKPPVLNIPEADAARDASLAWDEPRPPPGRWLVANVGPICQDRTPHGEGPVYSCAVNVVAYVSPMAARAG